MHSFPKPAAPHTPMTEPLRPVDLAPHPEGGRFREVYRSADRVTAAGGADRAAVTHIYFELRDGEVSRFHRVSSDEVWNLYRGDGVRLFQWDGAGGPVETVELSAAADTFCHVVPAGRWQAAEPTGGPVLVGCTVAPGFEFADFELLRPGPVADGLAAARPDLGRLVGVR